MTLRALFPHPADFDPYVDFTAVNLPRVQTWAFYPVDFLSRGHLHKNFHLPGMPGNVCRKGLKIS